ncbi:MAG: S-layer homology domain-containing protein [Hydrogeniiclostridium mannosilyticum]
MAGTGDNLFSPNVTISRGMIVTILYRLDGSQCFQRRLHRCDLGQWYTDAVNWAAASDIVAGYGNACSGPTTP